MISQQQFIPTVVHSIPRFGGHPPNANQQGCILHPLNRPLMIVAGPGSGKTTVLVLRALRMVFVDGLLPEQVLLTTFTKKAAAELRSRLIGWGLGIKTHLQQTASQPLRSQLDAIDINRFVTGTLDSICEDALTTLRQPSDPVPVMLESFVANAIFRSSGLFRFGPTALDDLDQYLANFTFSGDPPRNFGERLRTARSLIDRFVHDRVDLRAFENAPTHSAARKSLTSAFRAYRASLTQDNQLDFAALEEVFLERLTRGTLGRFTQNIRAVLVDEYQDTNPLQEEIYFELIRKTQASLTIVGDDDQSLYRFRGATVELFRDFINRYSSMVGNSTQPTLQHLTQNYRSTPEIVTYVNTFVANDPHYAPARVQPPKPPIAHQLATNGIPVLGMFRDSADALADSLSDFLMNVFRRNGHVLNLNGSQTTVVRDPSGGDFGDCVVLGHTVNEFKASFGPGAPTPRLPSLVRERLAAHNVHVFNPRGRALRDIPDVQRILGLMLECADGSSRLQQTMRLRADSAATLLRWRQEAMSFANSNPTPNRPHSLVQYIAAWQARRPQHQQRWPSEWPILELFFTLLSWFPRLRDEPEGQVYVECVARCITQAAVASPFRSQVLHGQGPMDDKSIENAIHNIFVPLADQELEIDEEIMPHVPRNRLAFMTIHQAKGLEFPLVIVDVSSDFRTNSPKNRGRRFPEEPNPEPLAEDDMMPFSAIGSLRANRTSLARSFDDLVRLYYVAFSRPQSALMLIGVDKCLQYSTTIKHVATSWRQDGTWSWRTPHTTSRPPAQANSIPLFLL